MSLSEDSREVRFLMAQRGAMRPQGLRKLVPWKLALQKLGVLHMTVGPLAAVWLCLCQGQLAPAPAPHQQHPNLHS